MKGNEEKCLEEILRVKWGRMEEAAPPNSLNYLFCSFHLQGLLEF